MARYEYSDGKSNKFWEIILEGSTFTVKFGKIGTTGQTQTKHFEGPEKAKAEHDKLVAEKLKKGYKPAVEAPAQTSAVKSAEAARPSFKPAKVKEPFRKDIYVYNDATGFLVTSRSQGGRYLADPSDAAWEAAVANGELIPIELYQDDSLIFRVVVGGDLTVQEIEEWIARLSRPLRIPDGKLALCAGYEFVGEMFDMDKLDQAEDEASDEYHWKKQIEEYVRFVDTPKGDYLCTIYTHITAPNGEPMMKVADPAAAGEKIGEFFRRTRPDESFPAWLNNMIMAYPDEDPGHEDEWADGEILDERDALFIGFLVHLQPIPKDYEPEKPQLDGGWFFSSMEKRRPEKCPMGLPVEGLEGYPEPVEPGEMYTFDLFSKVSGHEFSAVEGSAVEVPLDKIHQVFRLAWLCHAHVLPEVMITLPAGSDFPHEDPEMEFCKYLWMEDGSLDIRFGHGTGLFSMMRELEKIGAIIQGLPDGATLELAVSTISDDEPDTDPPRGLHRYRGSVQGGKWRIAETFPRLSAEELIRAMELSAEVDEGKVTALDEAEADQITKIYMKALGKFMQDNPLQRDGLTLSFKGEETRLIHEVACAAFALRHGGSWTVYEEEDDDEDDMDFPLYPVKEINPPQGELILDGAKSRRYLVSDARAIDEATTAFVERTDSAMAGLGLTPVGDLVCSLFPALVVRGYSTASGDMWGALMSASGGRGAVEFITYFSKDNASLTTSSSSMVWNDPARKSFKVSMFGKSPEELYQAHLQRRAELEKEYGPPAIHGLTMEALAVDVERSVSKQLGE